MYKYIKLYKESELNNNDNKPQASVIRTNKKGKIFIEVTYDGKIYYAPLMTPKEAGM